MKPLLESVNRLKTCMKTNCSSELNKFEEFREKQAKPIMKRMLQIKNMFKSGHFLHAFFGHEKR